MKLTPKLIPGSLHVQNKGSCDWGWQSMLAYGCHNFVVVVDPETVQIIQTLDLHQSNVVKVKWCRENYHHDLGCPYSLRLASADTTGHIIIWDVSQGISLSEFSDGSKPVLDLHWLWTQDASHDLLAALHSPSSLVLWNADTGIKLWKKTFQESLICFAFDPFSPAKVTLMSQEYLVFLNDFSVNQGPEGNGRRFYMTSSEGSSGSNNSLSSFGNSNTLRTPSKSAFQRVKLWAANESKTRVEEVNVALSECLQLVYHPSCRDLILLVFSREILFIDTAINQAIGSIYLERNSPSFTHAVLPCTQRDVIYTLHDNGSITMRCRRHVTTNPYPADSAEIEDACPDIIYENKCQSDAFRLSKSSYVSGFVACPVTETGVILLVSDGRLLIWNVKSTSESLSDTMLMSDECLKASLPLTATDTPLISAMVSSPEKTLADILPPSMQQGGVKNSFRFLLIGLLSNVQASPICAAMCPPMTTKNWPEYKPLVAVGSSSGSVQVFDLSVGLMVREFNLHSAPVRGVVWSSLKNFLSWSYWSHSSSVRSEVFMVDLKTGQNTPLPLSKNSEEKTITSIKVSQLKQYFAIVYKEKPLEIWDLKNLCLLREMSAHFPLISALEWSPSHYSKQKKKQIQQTEDKNSTAEGSEEKAANVLDSGKTEITTTPVWLKEHFIFTNTDGMLFHYFVEGTSVKDSSKVPPDGSMGNITSIAWKGDTVILGDADGNFSIWELRHRLSRNQSTHRGAIKKMKFAPGRGNVKLMLQFNDGVEIWDLGKSERTSSLRTLRDSVSVVDIDWYSSDVPLLLFSNGTMRMMDINLKRSCSPMSEQDLTDSLWCPHLLPPRKALMFKSILRNQPWNGKYTLDLDELYLSSQEKKDQVAELLSNLPDDIKDFLPEAPLGIAQRCFLAAQLYGDEGEVRFWSITLHYLRREKCRKACPAHKNGSSRTSRCSSRLDPEQAIETRRPRRKSLDLLSIDDDLDLNIPLDSDIENTEPCYCFPLSLDTSCDILCDPRTFQIHQLNRVALHDSKRSTYEHTKKCAETLVLLKQSDRAVQLFLETEANNSNYYTDSL
ncbi:WD repeat-containing 11, partial [Paramuricea clavata]